MRSFRLSKLIAMMLKYAAYLFVCVLVSTAAARAQEPVNLAPLNAIPNGNQVHVIQEVLNGLQINVSAESTSKDIVIERNPLYFIKKSSPYKEISNRIKYLQKAYNYSYQEALIELGFANRDEVFATVPDEMIEVYGVGADRLANTPDDIPVRSHMEMMNGDLSSRYYLVNGNTVLVQTLIKNGVTNGILKDRNSKPIRGCLIRENGEKYFYEYDQNQQVVIR